MNRTLDEIPGSRKEGNLFQARFISKLDIRTNIMYIYEGVCKKQCPCQFDHLLILDKQNGNEQKETI